MTKADDFCCDWRFKGYKHCQIFLYLFKKNLLSWLELFEALGYYVETIFVGLCRLSMAYGNKDCFLSNAIKFEFSRRHSYFNQCMTKWLVYSAKTDQFGHLNCLSDNFTSELNGYQSAHGVSQTDSEH